jgi:hypothetical protein
LWNFASTSAFAFDGTSIERHGQTVNTRGLILSFFTTHPKDEMKKFGTVVLEITAGS